MIVLYCHHYLYFLSNCRANNELFFFSRWHTTFLFLSLSLSLSLSLGFCRAIVVGYKDVLCLALSATSKANRAAAESWVDYKLRMRKFINRFAETSEEYVLASLPRSSFSCPGYNRDLTHHIFGYIYRVSQNVCAPINEQIERKLMNKNDINHRSTIIRSNAN